MLKIILYIILGTLAVTTGIVVVRTIVFQRSQHAVANDEYRAQREQRVMLTIRLHRSRVCGIL
jgi:hypothetical protein